MALLRQSPALIMAIDANQGSLPLERQSREVGYPRTEQGKAPPWLEKRRACADGIY